MMPGSQDRPADAFAFVGGCPRSGTTWLQLLLARHPDVYTARETHLFDRYIEPLLGSFRNEGDLSSDDGMHGFVGDRELEEEIIAPLAEKVMTLYAGGRRGESLILEKTPGHIRQFPLIQRIFPGARFIEVVRDPRAVLASWKAASRERWGGWTRKGSLDVVFTWVRYALAGIDAKSRLADDVITIRYEDLHEDPADVLCSALAHLRLDCDDALIAEAVSSLEINRIKKQLAAGGALGHFREERENFFRKGQVDSWKDELTPDEVSMVGLVCGEIVRSRGLGYFS